MSLFIALELMFVCFNFMGREVVFQWILLWIGKERGDRNMPTSYISLKQGHEVTSSERKKPAHVILGSGAD